MFIENKYYKWYQNLTSNKIEKEGYTEKHHIIPKCLGGTNEKENLVTLTAREHYIAHLLLTKCISEEYLSKMLYAYVMMATVKDSVQDRTFKVNSRLFENKKLESIKFKKDFKHTNESKDIISKKMKGIKKKPFSEEHKKNLSEALKGKKPWNKGLKDTQKFSDETKKKMSESAKGRIVKPITKIKLSENALGTITCYDKIQGKCVKISSDEFYNNKNIRYIATSTNEYKLNYKEQV